MSQAAESRTTNRIAFSSAGAVRRPRPPVPASAIDTAHATLIDTLAGLRVTNIPASAADHHDLVIRALHIRKAIAALTAYTKAIIADTDYLIPVPLHDETDGLADAAATICAAFHDAADRMLDDQAAA